MNILSIQSHVVYGHVGHQASTFPLQRLGHEVLVVAPTFDGKPLPPEKEKIVERIPSLRNFNGSEFSVRLPLAAALSDRLEAFQADVMHAHHPFLLGDTALRMALNKNVPTAPNGADLKQRLDTISGRYTPIAGDVGQGWYPRPLYYGLLLAQQFGGARFVPTQLVANGANLTAYAADKDGRRLVALFNKDLQRDVTVRVEPGASASRLRLWRLEADAIDTVHDVRLAGSEVAGNGDWSPRHEETVAVDGGHAQVSLPRGSAALAFIEA